MSKELPLRELSINDLYISGDQCTYEIPIYQRNYAWSKDEISTLIQDVYDAYKKKSKKYYIGTLVSFNKGDNVYEIIDGQQRLTTIRIILGTFCNDKIKNSLKYRARKKSDDTLNSLPEFNKEIMDYGIVQGYKFAKNAIESITQDTKDKDEFFAYLLNDVHIIHYQVPKDIDLNHYFEIMNSRGEQLEKHEIVKAQLMNKLDNQKERSLFSRIWVACSEMGIYIQQKLKSTKVFGEDYSRFPIVSFESMLNDNSDNQEEDESLSILDILGQKEKNNKLLEDDNKDRLDLFQPIIDFPNFLLIVLKITRMNERSFDPQHFNLDDKELINEFSCDVDPKVFVINLLKARFYLDNYIIHHSKEEDKYANNPWRLRIWKKDNNRNASYSLVNSLEKEQQDKMIQLLSMFEVSYTARQRKNYLFYCLMYLMQSDRVDGNQYLCFVVNLAKRYLMNVYMDESKLNEKNNPKPNSFDEVILRNRSFEDSEIVIKNTNKFEEIYGNGVEASKGIPIFIFNYLDYKLWELYSTTRSDEDKKAFWDRIGCSKLDLNECVHFYFSRTRTSLEHYYPQAQATGEGGKLDKNQINCFGNYAMIGSEANSSGSNWDPLTKISHYRDDRSGKIKQVSVASLKFAIMMQSCQDNKQWTFNEIKGHQDKMIEILLS